MTILMVRVPGSSKTEPTLQLCKDGQPVPDPELKLQIAGREDVKPAIERGLSLAKQMFNVELHPTGRNRWSSEPSNVGKTAATDKATPIDKAGLKNKLQNRGDVK